MTNVTRAENFGASGGAALHAGWTLGAGLEKGMEYLAFTWSISVYCHGAQIEQVAHVKFVFQTVTVKGKYKQYV